jgi:prepilin signal peptidase PulO-like enzyme (type II secretory pathway)
MWYNSVEETGMVWTFTLLGLITGILLNICADSLPASRRLRRPVCLYCQRPRSPGAWSGVVAYLIRRHRCPSCGAPISIRHVIVELVTALFFAFCWLRGGAIRIILLNALYGTVFILVTVTDLEHRLIPHAFMLPAIALATAGAFVNPSFGFPVKGLLGGGIGLVSALGLYVLGGVFTGIIGQVRQRPVAETAFGFGDVTLITFIGLVSGAPEILFALAIGLLSGGGFAALFLLIQGVFRKKYTPFTAVPYGPFLILGGVVMLYFGAEFMAWYTGG